MKINNYYCVTSYFFFKDVYVCRDPVMRQVERALFCGKNTLRLPWNSLRTTFHGVSTADLHACTLFISLYELELNWGGVLPKFLNFQLRVEFFTNFKIVFSLFFSLNFENFICLIKRWCGKWQYREGKSVCVCVC